MLCCLGGTSGREHDRPALVLALSHPVELLARGRAGLHPLER